jgi:metal-dependent hydrolase (beta-lactamase superfamily II)
MTVLASGSKGNATVIAAGSTRILVDAGMSCRELLRRMELAGEDPCELDAILITHEHLDHVAGLAVLAHHHDVRKVAGKTGGRTGRAGGVSGTCAGAHVGGCGF